MIDYWWYIVLHFIDTAYISTHTIGLTFWSLREQIPRMIVGERDLLHAMGLWDAMIMSVIWFHSAMLMALMERWDTDTSTFSLLVGEMTITLEDVYHIIHLPIRGNTMRYRSDQTEEDYKREQVYVVGRVIRSEMRGHIMVRCLLHPIDEVPLVRWLVIVTLAQVVCPNGCGIHMHGELIYTIWVIERHRRVYS